MTVGGFNTQQVKDVVSFVKGKPPSEQPYFGTDAELYLTPEYLRGGAASEPIRANKNAARVNGGETIVLWDGSNAGEVFRARAGVLSSTMVHLKPVDSFDGDYFFYAMKGWEGYLKGQTSGSGIPHVDKEVLGKLELVQFPTVEQSKIAEILSTVEHAIEQTEALIAKQQRIKTGLMQDLLTRGIDEHGQLRTEQTHAFKDSPLGRIPAEWEVKAIGEVFDVQLGKMLSQKSSNGLAPFFYLGNKNVQWDRVDLSDLQMMDFDAREREKFELRHNDILMCEGGEVGRTSLWKGELADCYYQKAIHRLRPKNGAYLPELFPRFIQWGIRQGLLGDFTSQTSIAHLTQEKLNTVPIIIPTIPDQEALVLRLNSHDIALANLSSSALKLQSVKRALMQDLLTGRKRVTDLLEPAAA